MNKTEYKELLSKNHTVKRNDILYVLRTMFAAEASVTSTPMLNDIRVVVAKNVKKINTLSLSTSKAKYLLEPSEWMFIKRDFERCIDIMDASPQYTRQLFGTYVAVTYVTDSHDGDYQITSSGLVRDAAYDKGLKDGVRK